MVQKIKMLLVLCLIVSLRGQSDAQNILDPNYYINLAIGAVENLNTTVMGIEYNIIDILRGLQDDLSSGSMTIKKTLNGTLVEGVNFADNIIYDVAKMAAGVGLNVTNCIRPKDPLTQVPVDLVNNEYGCLSKEIDGLNSLINASLTNVLNLQNAIFNMTTQLRGCRTGGNAIGCAINVIFGSQSTLETLISSVYIITDFSKFFVGLRTRIATCAAVQLFNTFRNASVTIGRLLTCVSNDLIG